MEEPKTSITSCELGFARFTHCATSLPIRLVPIKTHNFSSDNPRFSAGYPCFLAFPTIRSYNPIITVRNVGLVDFHDSFHDPILFVNLLFKQHQKLVPHSEHRDRTSADYRCRHMHWNGIQRIQDNGRPNIGELLRIVTQFPT